jgi:hypothetical protein
MLQSVHVFEAQVLRKSLGSEFEIAWGYSILDNPRRTALRIPSRGFLHWSVARAGPGARGATIMGRHLQTVTFADVVASNATSRTQSYRRGSTRDRGHTGASAQRRSAIGRSQACSSEMSRLV